MVFEVLIERAFSRISSILVEKAENKLQDAHVTLRHKLKTEPKRILECLENHQSFINEWSESVFIDTMDTPKSVEELFVNLNLRKGLRRDDVTTPEEDERREEAINISDLRTDRHTLLYGEIGSGKTTTLQYTSRQHNSSSDNRSLIVILLRELQEGLSIYDVLSKLFELEIELDPEREKYREIRGFSLSSKFLVDARLQIICELLASVRATLVLDGFDEVPLAEREIAASQIEGLIRRAPLSNPTKANLNDERTQPVIEGPISGSGINAEGAKIVIQPGYDYSVILTSRPGEFEKKVPGFDVYDLLPLAKDQREKLVLNWLGREEAERFWEEIEGLNYVDMTTKPLLLTILCNIFGNDKKLPAQQKVIYKKAIGFYIEEWDRTRGINRSTRYAKLSPESKFEFLSAFAFNIIDLTNTARPTFDSRLSRMIYERIHARFQLPSHESSEVIRDIESTTGVIRRIGYDRYEFAHKSLQEYLAGDYISRLGDLSRLNINLWSFPNELAVAIALSADPSQRFLELGGFFQGEFAGGAQFAEPFLRRLIAEKPGFGSNILVASWFMHLLNRTERKVALELFRQYVSEVEQRRAMLVLSLDGGEAIDRHLLDSRLNIKHTAAPVPKFLQALLN